VARKALPKKERQNQLIEKLKEDPFLTDEELSESFGVSIQTIRLDRLELGIPELRERIKNVAEINHQKLKSIKGQEIVGELVDIDLGKSGISIFQTEDDMVFENSRVVKGHYILPRPSPWLWLSLMRRWPLQVLQISSIRLLFMQEIN